MGGVVTTIKDRCKRCYTCVRSCPVKAIKVEEGQAQVVEERCIDCGMCFRVCAQDAKQIQHAIDRVYTALAAEAPTLALLAPSFPALFPAARPGQIVAAIRALGFDEVLEVAYGAELVARAYGDLFHRDRSLVISTACPAVTSYVQKYKPSLVPYLAPIVSPAVALGRVCKQIYRPGATTVFIGPCVAKKAEFVDPDVEGAVDIGLSFSGLRRMLRERGVAPTELTDDDFDGPRAGNGRLFPVPGGLLKAAALNNDVLDNDILVVEGPEEAISALDALSKGELQARFVDILFCRGCIDGPTMDPSISVFARKEAVANYARSRTQVAQRRDLDLSQSAGANLRRHFTASPVLHSHPPDEAIDSILERIGKRRAEDQLNCGACGYPTCREKAMAVHAGLAEVEMCLPFLIEQLQEHLKQLRRYQEQLQDAQAQIVQSEKMASMGQLAAGIAHELNNPLGSILLYTHLVKKELDSSSTAYEDVEFIAEETNRCKSIVSGLLNFARQRQVHLRTTDINSILEEVGHRASRQPDYQNVAVELALEHGLPAIPADPHQLKEVFWNLVTNALEAMPRGGTITIKSGLSPDGTFVVISVTDTGVGIDESGLKRLFTPFHTTKPTGTGLGLAIAYGIIKMHRGSIEAASKVNEGTTFTISLPIRLPATGSLERTAIETIG